MVAGETSSFDESGYTQGPLRLVSFSGLEREAQERLTEGLVGFTTSNILSDVLQEAVLARATYIHVALNHWECSVRYRIGTSLWEANAFPKHGHPALCARLKMISGVNIAERRLPQFGRFLYDSSRHLYEMQVSTIPTMTGEAFVIKLLEIVRRGDYSVERHDLLDSLTREDILAQIQQLQRGKTE